MEATFKKKKIIPGNLRKNLEISWNFVILGKWEPWYLLNSLNEILKKY